MTTKPEPILTPEQWQYVTAAAGDPVARIAPVDPMPEQLAAHQRRIAELSQPPVGYVVLAKRPTYRGEDYPFSYDTAGSIWPTIDPCENHQAYSQGIAAREPENYGEVEYVIAEVRVVQP